MSTMLPSERDRESDRTKKLNHDHQDLISLLPAHMLQYILSSMPTIDAVRSSTLSRTWLHAWNSLPVFTFNFACETELLEETLPLITEFYNNTICILSEKEAMPVSFHVSWPSFQNDLYATCINEWMRVVSRHLVRELEIDVLPEERGGGGGGEEQEEEEEDEDEEEEEEDEDEDGGLGRTMKTYNLPHETLFAIAEPLVVLKLRGCTMPFRSLQIESRNLVSLRVLFWECFWVAGHNAAEELLSLCPVLEECTLISVSKRFPSILLSDHRKLKHLKLDGFLDVTLEYLPNLQVLDVTNYRCIERGEDSNNCNELRKLILKTCRVTDLGNLQYFVYHLRSLESLVLNIDGAWPISLSNCSIQSFSFSSFTPPRKIEVIAPRLGFYEYRSSMLTSTSFETNPFELKRIDLVLTLEWDDTYLFFIYLKSNLLKLAAYSYALKLTINAKKFSPLELPPGKDRPPPPPAFVGSVELQDIHSSLIYNKSLLRWLFLCSRPLQLSTRPSYFFLQAFREIMDGAKLQGNFCSSRCIRLRAVKVETRCGIEDFSDIKIDENCELLSEDLLRFRLEWL